MSGLKKGDKMKTREEISDMLYAAVGTASLIAAGFEVAEGDGPELTSSDVATLADVATERVRYILSAASKLSGGKAAFSSVLESVLVTFSGAGDGPERQPEQEMV